METDLFSFHTSGVAVVALILFWILDFRFWIRQRLVCMGFLCPFVAIIFQIGINYLDNLPRHAKIQRH